MLTVYSAYRVHHPRIAEIPTSTDGAQIARAVEEVARQEKGKRPRFEARDYEAASQSLACLADWIHTAPDAAFWQGENDRGKKYLGVDTLFKAKGLSARLESARAWKEGETKEPRSRVRGWHPGQTEEQVAEGERLLEEMRRAHG